MCGWPAGCAPDEVGGEESGMGLGGGRSYRKLMGRPHFLLG